MYENSKDIITCPVCGRRVEKFQGVHYFCDKCNWDSLENTVDISYSDNQSAPLSNLFPHNFTIYDFLCPNQVIKCQSMESFIQSLRVKDIYLQKKICEDYSGYMAYKMRLSLPDWRKDGFVYWRGNAIKRNSKEYQYFITMAYDCLYEGNDVFRELVIPHFKDKILIHSTGCETQSETILTETEYLFQLKKRLIY